MSGLQVFLALAAGAISAYFLADGIRTGVMRCFVSVALNGEASRKSNPVWFWAWTGLNVLMVIGAVVIVASALAHAIFPCAFARCA